MLEDVEHASPRVRGDVIGAMETALCVGGAGEEAHIFLNGEVAHGIADPGECGGWESQFGGYGTDCVSFIDTGQGNIDVEVGGIDQELGSALALVEHGDVLHQGWEHLGLFRIDGELGFFAELHDAFGALWEQVGFDEGADLAQGENLPR